MLSVSVFFRWIQALVFALAITVPVMAYSQEAPADKPFKTEELDQMLAPIALYPDELLTNVLMASTYPLEVVQAARWQKDPAHSKLKGDALAKALEDQDWDPSIKSLVQFPEVIQSMSDKLDWTQKLGDAFLAQQQDVMDRVQFLRAKADAAGSLKSNEQQKVVRQEKYIVIEPAKPDVIYVPVYQPTVVYGTWWYPSYPPYYWSYGYPASAFARGFFWGAGVAVANSIWGWNRYDWRRNDININVNKYNKINVNRTQINSNTWKHNPQHRGSVPYRDKSSRAKYGKNIDKKRDASRDFRGFDKTGPAKRPEGGPGKRPDGKPVQRPEGKPVQRPEGGPGKRPEAKPAQRPASKPDKRPADKPAQRPATKPKKKAAPKHKASPPSANKSSNAMNVKNGRDVRMNSSRGHASRNASAAGRGGGKRGGGGRRR